MDVYFNPNCGTCRTVRSILEERGVDAHYVGYLQQAPTREEIERVMDLLGLEDPRGMIRDKEPVYA
jgi:arsenate reductase